ncbi:DUF885 domain-containing protein [Novosphingobium sp. KACC 22771]|uniref:DUF885 domain-containing protein n=1 Tax=Novosphingobium sp. KACC 22771 TaxID=3025670 RepID=UPI0023671197|nr:DUF885 domain-containing protein [Novosphingobium sp. KACC 22771]WDF74975.1 DUF885 domain-containing protein [Novosphingobium sp. KACC 22771]
MDSLNFSRRAALTGAAAAALPRPIQALAAKAAGASHSPGAALLDTLAWGLLERVPTSATSLGVDTGAHARLRGALDDRSPAGVAATRAFLDDALARLDRVERGGLDASTLTSLTVTQSAFRTARQGMALPYGDATIGGWRNTPYCVIQNVGGWIDISQLLDGDQPVRDAADADYYLQRLTAMPALLDGETARIAHARGIGLVPPDFLLDKTIAGMTRSIAEAARSDGPLVAPLMHKAAKVPGLDAAALGARAERIISQGVIPALQRQLAEIRAQRAVATGDAGMRPRPHGEEWYAWGLRASTTTRRTPEEIHAIGRARLVELSAQMDTILRSLGLTQGSVADRMNALQQRPDITFGTDDAAREKIVAYMNAKLTAMREKLPSAFRRLARGNLEIRRMPLAEEPGAPSAYGGPGSIDGRIPGKIWVNLGDPAIHNRVSIPDLVFHEGIPGHVWQGEYAQALPLIRSILAFNAYSEGWALYSEQLADELDMYADDPAGRLGYLMGLSWRAARLVVDTGIHAQGWSRDQALNEFIAATGLPLSNAVSEVERYCAWPGQACGYMLGQIEINAQRERARARLGARFDLRDFNQTVVDGGNVPLDVLAQNVTRYIEAE